MCFVLFLFLFFLFICNIKKQDKQRTSRNTALTSCLTSMEKSALCSSSSHLSARLKHEQNYTLGMNTITNVTKISYNVLLCSTQFFPFSLQNVFVLNQVLKLTSWNLFRKSARSLQSSAMPILCWRNPTYLKLQCRPEHHWLDIFFTWKNEKRHNKIAQLKAVLLKNWEFS